MTLGRMIQSGKDDSVGPTVGLVVKTKSRHVQLRRTLLYSWYRPAM